MTKIFLNFDVQAYVELFISPENVARLLRIIEDFKWITYHIVNHDVGQANVEDFQALSVVLLLG